MLIIISPKFQESLPAEGGQPNDLTLKRTTLEDKQEIKQRFPPLKP